MLYFIRHGESEANVRGVFAGQKDNSKLTEKGKEQALVTAKEIKAEKIKIDRIISSPLDRAKETAQIIAKEINFNLDKIEINKDIIEYDMGTLTGTPVHKISSKLLISAENAEDPKLFKERIYKIIKELSKLNKNILLVSHAGVGRMVETLKINGGPESFYDLSPYGNASLVKIDWIK